MQDTEPTERQFQALAAAVAHDLRTPLSALSGEVELALRRERSPAAYREALSRIAERVTELLDLSGDLAVLAQPAAAMTAAAPRVNLGVVLRAAQERCSGAVRERFAVDGDPSATVAGDEARLVRALTLLIDHAVRHRGESARVLIRSSEAPADIESAGYIDLLLCAGPLGFAATAWLHLDRGRGDGEPVYASGLIRLRTASRLIADCGGSLEVLSADRPASVRIRLRRA